MSVTLLYTNPLPPPRRDDPGYLAGIAAIREAVKSGKKIRVSMELPEGSSISYFSTELTAVKVEADYVSGILPMRPVIDNDARAIASNGMVAGSVDSLGNYNYGVYRFGSDTWAPSTSPSANAAAYPGYATTWWADD